MAGLYARCCPSFLSLSSLCSVSGRAFVCLRRYGLTSQLSNISAEYLSLPSFMVIQVVSLTSGLVVQIQGQSPSRKAARQGYLVVRHYPRDPRT
ncbi:hypothetical protein CYLTODRAFT_220282 [Cylindrobasidium torrendii FP15055 ss-10]|uniref:Uncharacterized protein n=1 Tax=Cylindrobasidium torrendii FP15055 ss-10 TaxID=1314674 RepID=A0A0D7BTU4_9AGAR|nr:hypothetical protein CYLTODRAFT_220282 [Cylindrobasidium torrendii FP15055 ss-10]